MAQELDEERAELDGGEELDAVEWSREWEWPQWLQRVHLRRVRGWRPDPPTFAVMLLLMFTPFLVGGLWNVRTEVERLFAYTPDPFQTDGLVPSWVRVYDGAVLGLHVAEVAILAGALLILARRLRLGATMAAAAVLAHAMGNAVLVVVYVRAGPAPTSDMAQILADVCTRLLLTIVALLLLLRVAPPAKPADALAPSPPP